MPGQKLRPEVQDNKQQHLQPKDSILHSSTFSPLFLLAHTHQSDIRLLFLYGLVVANKTRRSSPLDRRPSTAEAPPIIAVTLEPVMQF